MAKVLIKMKYDMNDADYIYGVHAMDKERWEKWKKLYCQMDTLYKYSNNDECDRSPEEFFKWYIKEQEITDEEYNVLNKLGLIGFGERLPNAYYKPAEDYIDSEAPEYTLAYWDSEQQKRIDVEADI